MTDAATIAVPGRHDVLCGRGQMCFRHQGNRDFRDMVADMVQSYVEASRPQKTTIVRAIIKRVFKKGGRFLRRNAKGLWYDSGTKGAKEKVGHTLRDATSDRLQYIRVAKEEARARSQQTKKVNDDDDADDDDDDEEEEAEEEDGDDEDEEYIPGPTASTTPSPPPRTYPRERPSPPAMAVLAPKVTPEVTPEESTATTSRLTSPVAASISASTAAASAIPHPPAAAPSAVLSSSTRAAIAATEGHTEPKEALYSDLLRHPAQYSVPQLVVLRIDPSGLLGSPYATAAAPTTIAPSILHHAHRNPLAAAWNRDLLHQQIAESIAQQRNLSLYSHAAAAAAASAAGAAALESLYQGRW